MTRLFLTFSDKNQFKFICPIFNVETQFRACNKLRDLVYVADYPPVRRGCQACIQASKCPVAEIIRRISFSNNRNPPDTYGSETPVLGRIERSILERIAPVIVPDKLMEKLGVPPAEQALIKSSSARIYKLIGETPPDAEPVSERTAERASAPRRAPKKADRGESKFVNKAAETGDLAAAVSM